MSDTTPTQQTEPPRGLGSGPWIASRLAWSLWAACVVLVSLTVLLHFITDDTFPFKPWERPDLRFAVLTEVLSLAYPTVGALIASRLPRNPIGWIFCGVGLLFEVHGFAMAYADYAFLMDTSLPGGEYAAWFSTVVNIAGYGLAGVWLALIFPDGRLPSPRWRIVAAAAVVGTAMLVVGEALMPGTTRTHGFVVNPFGIAEVIGGGLTTYQLFPAMSVAGTALLIISGVAALVSLFLRLHRAEGDERQQVKWFLYAAVPSMVGANVIFVEFMVATYTTNFYLRPIYFLPWRLSVGINYVSLFSMCVVPVFTYIAILRYRLFDIDAVINRTLVYGALTACVVGIYVVAVGALGVLFQEGGNLVVSLVATGAVALLFQPLRGRLQRGVNRLMYGERDDPYAATSRLGRRLEAALAPEAVLPTVVETIAQALKLPYVAILLKEGARFKSAAAYGSPTGETESLPLVYQREEIGRLLLAPRSPGEGFSAADRRLLEDLARHAEVAVHAVRLTADLQRSRERLVATREEERRRLRRDLHDGIGPSLTGLALQLNAARRLVASDRAEDAEQTLANLERRAGETLAEMRRVIYGLRPPALDDLGLIPSICQQASGHGMLDVSARDGTEGCREGGPAFSLEAPEELPPLPAAVEVACYRIAQEAITNVARHARAGTCRVRLSVDEAADALELEITDDGAGMPGDLVAGVGLHSMRERAEELGGTLEVEAGPEGGTRVLARLPLSASEEYPVGASSWSASSVSS